jgi:regulator of protease activity HflC (stomatin/prohibitin superfamily)
MNIDFLASMIPLLLILVLLAKTAFVIQENQRLVVLRMGKLNKVIGPGFSFIVPFTDLGIIVELSKYLPSWQQMTEEELCAKVTDMVKYNPDPKAFR